MTNRSSVRRRLYLPTSRLPYTMSGVDTCRFWCLMDGQKPFSAVVEVNGNVEDLTREIQKEKQDLLDYDTSDIVLLKLNDPIQISPVKTLTQRIRDTNPPVELDDPSSKLLKEFRQPPTEGQVQVIVLKPSAVDRLAKKPRLERTPTEGKQWSVCGAIDPHVHYHVDPATQDESKTCLDRIRKAEFCLLTGSRASGKTTRLFQIGTQLDEAGDWSLYVSLHGLDLSDPTEFWESFGHAVANDARRRSIPFPEVTISSQSDFLDAFHVNKWSQKLVLLLDELSVLYSASDDVRNQCLGALRELRNGYDEYAVCSVLAAGTFSVVHLNPTDNSLSPFNVATHVTNPNFTLDETRSLFQQYTKQTGITVEDEVIKDVWTRSGGHPGMTCLCGCMISQNEGLLVRNGALTYQDWFKFPDVILYEEISSYNTFRSMIKSLYHPNATAAVRLLRSDFLGYAGDVTLLDFQDQCLANFLTAEGVLFKQHGSPTYRMTSALVDGLVRRNVIVNLFPNAPQINPKLDESGQIDFLMALTESLKFFDKEHIRSARSRSFKSSKAVEVDGSPNAQIPRDSTYDTELMRILSNWLQRHHGWTVTGQWHLKNPFGQHRYPDIVLKKPENPSIVLKLVATGDEDLVNSHIDKMPEYMDLLGVQQAWIIHFTRGDCYDPVWQSDDMLNKGVNLVHIRHNLEFTDVRMIANWKDSTGITHLDTDWQAISS